MDDLEVDEIFVEFFGQPLEVTELGYKFRMLRDDTLCNGCKEKIERNSIGIIPPNHRTYHPECARKRVLLEGL